jgi:hypothetical protein
MLGKEFQTEVGAIDCRIFRFAGIEKRSKLKRKIWRRKRRWVSVFAFGFHVQAISQSYIFEECQ